MSERDRMRPHTGKLRDHFGFKLNDEGQVVDADRIVCCHCLKEFAYHGSNTSLRYHLQKIHPGEYLQLQAREELDGKCPPQHPRTEVPVRVSLRERSSFKQTEEKKNQQKITNPKVDAPQASDHVTNGQVASCSTSYYNAVEDCRIFGEFVASELRSLHSESNRRLLKRKIQMVILEVSESDDLDTSSYRTVGTFSPPSRGRLCHGLLSSPISTDSTRSDHPTNSPVAAPLTVHASDGHVCIKYELESD